MAEKQQKNWLATIGGRKFLGFLIATAAMLAGRLDGEWWIVAFAIYVGGNVYQKIGLGRLSQPEAVTDTERRDEEHVPEA